MSRFWIRRTTLLATLLLILMAAALHGAPTVIESKGMHVSLELDRTDIVVGEPIYIKLVVTNKSAALRQGNFSSRLFMSEGNDLHVTVEKPGELPFSYRGVETGAIYTSTELSTNIGESIHQEFMILYDAKEPNGYLFGKPGEYGLDVKLFFSVYRDPERVSLAIPPTRIKVRAPEGKAAEAFKLIDNKAAAMALHAAGTTNDAVFKAIKEVADTFSNTPYGPLALLTTGATQMRIHGDYPAAIATFRKFLERYPDNIRASAVLFNIVYCYHQLRDFDNGRDWFNYLADHDPSFVLLRPENPTSSAFFFGPASEAQGRRWWLYTEPWDVRISRKQEGVPQR